MNAKRMSFIALCALGLLALPAAYPLAVQAADAPAIQAKEGWYKALVDYESDPEKIARRAMAVAAEVCVFTNDRVTVEVIEA